jgi:uncharacterized protein YecT (DUF1311 family)
MDTQRDMDESADSRAERAETRMRSLFLRIRELFGSVPEIKAALDISQTAFEDYRERQMELISVTTNGTVGPLLRAATYYQLTVDREAHLRLYLADAKPDESVPD